MKRLLSIILTICMLLTVMPLGIFDLIASAATSGYYTYSISNGEATLTKCNTSVSGSITIPSSLDGYPVRKIWAYAFSKCSNLTGVTIPSTVTYLGSFAFESCTKLARVSIPNSVTTIEDDAFYNCTSLTSVTIPDSVTYLGGYVFSNCSNLRSVTLPQKITQIGSSTFRNCTALTSIIIPDSVTTIGSYAFCGCVNLESVTIPKNVTTIGYSAFDDCENLKNVYYKGTKTQKSNISFGTFNTYLSNATWHYNTITDGSNHYSKTIITKPTCTAKGYTTYVCETCGKSYIGNYVNALGHSFSTWKIRTNATCTTSGEEYRTCTSCKYEEVNVISATGHIYKNGVCAVCNEYLESPHNYPNRYDETWTISHPNASSISVTFSSETYVQKGYDYIYIYDAHNNEIGKYTGNELAFKTINIAGDTVKIRLQSDESVSGYGIKLTDISVNYTIGDINGDNVINALDLCALRAVILKLVDYENNFICDCNGDSKINILDLIRLKKYLIGQDVILGI